MRRWNLMAGTMRRTSSSLKSHAKGWPLWWVKYRSSKPVGQKRGWDIHSFTSSVNCALTLTAIGITCTSLIQLHFFFLLTCTSLWLGFGIIWIWAIPVPLSIAHSGSKRFSTLVLSAGRAKKTFAWFKFRVLKLQPSIFSGQQRYHSSQIQGQRHHFMWPVTANHVHRLTSCFFTEIWDILSICC